MTTRKLPHGAILLILVFLALFAIGYYLRTSLTMTGGVWGTPLDDAWIHFQFARNLSQGNGFSFNPGDPQPGSTAPLWTILLAGVGIFSEDFLIPALILSAVFLIVAICLSYGFAYYLTNSQFVGFLAGLGVLTAGRLIWAGLSGMEVTAFAALSVAAVWLYTIKGFRLGSAFLFALASQVRPEGHALFALALLDALYDWFIVHKRWSLANWKATLRQFIPPLLLYFIVALPYTLFSLRVTGHPLANTFYAKVGSEYFFSLKALRQTMAFHWNDNPVSLILVVVGLRPTWKQSRLTVLWLLGLWLLTPIIVDEVWHHGRYTMPLIPFQMITAAVGVHWLLQKISRSAPSPPKIYRGLALITIILFLIVSKRQFQDWASILGLNVKEVIEIDVALGEWLAENTAADALIAVDDIGAITFLSERKIVDMNGLVSPEVWPAVRQPVGLLRDTELTRILSPLQPDYIVAFPLWHWEISQNTAVATPIHKVETDSHTIIFQPEATVYKATWPYITDAQPQIRLNAQLGEMIRLLGIDMDVGDTAVNLTLYWQSIQPAAENYDVFIHVVDEDGRIVAQVDQKPLNGLTPTSIWQPGDTVRQLLIVPLPPDLPGGEYHIIAGLYLVETGQRLPTTGPDALTDTILLRSFNVD
ncbi:MAG: hypothetical protein GY796_04130 [Chloroflexi bacterium]|nr:hypothetical protein [Chloroflexota bacterium]